MLESVHMFVFWIIIFIIDRENKHDPPPYYNKLSLFIAIKQNRYICKWFVRAQLVILYLIAFLPPDTLTEWDPKYI